MDVKFDDDTCKIKFGFLHSGDVFLGHLTEDSESSPQSIYMKTHKIDSDYNAVNVRTGWPYYFGSNDNVVPLDACLNVKMKGNVGISEVNVGNE